MIQSMLHDCRWCCRTNPVLVLRKRGGDMYSSGIAPKYNVCGFLWGKHPEGFFCKFELYHCHIEGFFLFVYWNEAFFWLACYQCIFVCQNLIGTLSSATSQRHPGGFSHLQSGSNLDKKGMSRVFVQARIVSKKKPLYRPLYLVTSGETLKLILLHTLNPQERWGTHKKRWPFQPRPFADVIGLVRLLIIFDDSSWSLDLCRQNVIISLVVCFPIEAKLVSPCPRLPSPCWNAFSPEAKSWKQTLHSRRGTSWWGRQCGLSTVWVGWIGERGMVSWYPLCWNYGVLNGGGGVFKGADPP